MAQRTKTTHTTQAPPAAQSTTQAPRRRRGNLFRTTFTLASWRLRQTWRLLLLSGLGTIAAVMLVCAVPLFSEIALSAGLRGVLANDPSASQLVIQSNGNLTTESQVQQIQQQLNQYVHSDLGNYVPGGPIFSIALNNLPVASVGPSPVLQPDQNGPSAQMNIAGVDDSAMTDHITLISGRLPQANPNALEVGLTQNAATALQAKVGTVIMVTPPQFGPASGTPPTIPLLVTCIYTVNQAGDPIFTGNPFFGQFGQYGVAFGSGVNRGQNQSKPLIAVASNQAMLSALAAFENNASVKGNVAYPGPPPFNWYYHIDISQVTIDNADDLTGRLQNFESHLFNNLSGVPGFQPAGPPTTLLDDLIQFKVQIFVAQVPVVLLLLQVFGLILLFISLMINLLVEHQAEAIAVLRSRGAPRGLIFRAMTVQTICICLLALVVGPVLAFLLVGVIASNALAGQQNGALSVILGHPLQTAWGLRWYALIAVLCAFVAMVISTYRAANQNILALRRDSARSNRKPFWQRLNLDLIIAIVALACYGLYTVAVNRVPAGVRIFLSWLAPVATIFFLVAAALIFLRFFPTLLRLGARLASRSRNAAPMLAIGQMARSPRQASRMTLLLGLSTAFALFALIFSASQYQRTLDVASFTVGSDFSGQLKVGTFSPSDLTASYQRIPGVTSATLAYTDSVSPDNPVNNLSTIQIVAADASTYGQTVLWPDQSGNPVQLAGQLASQRDQAVANDTVPAVVDQAFAQAMQVTTGSHFTVRPSGYKAGLQTMHFTVQAVVRNIPTLFDDADTSFNTGNAGLLVDYQTFAAVYKADTQTAAPLPTMVWLRTLDDSASLASVRAALSHGPLAVDQLQDRRANIEQTQRNPLLIDLFGTLDMGAATALALALLGILVASWLSARGRIVNFALLRAMGTEPRQLTSVLLWEQGIVYALSIALGLAAGLLLSILVLPVLVIANSITDLNHFDPTKLDIPPVHAVLPVPLLGAALGVLVILCVISIVLMTAIASRASISQALRLNED